MPEHNNMPPDALNSDAGATQPSPVHEEDYAHNADDTQPAPASDAGEGQDTPASAPTGGAGKSGRKSRAASAPAPEPAAAPEEPELPPLHGDAADPIADVAEAAAPVANETHPAPAPSQQADARPPRGVVTMATHNPVYARMAYNLAVSCKASDKDVPVYVYADKACADVLKALNAQFKAIDRIVNVPPAWMHSRISDNDRMFCKLNVLAALPFMQTIFIDADSVLVNRTGVLARQFEIEARNGHDLHTQVITTFPAGGNLPAKTYTYWCEPATAHSYLLGKHKIKVEGEIPVCSSTYVYMTQRAAPALAFALDAYKDEDVSFVERMHGGMADELFLNLALLSGKCKAGKEPFDPVYFPFYSRHKPLMKVAQSNFAYTTGRNTAPTGGAIQSYNHFAFKAFVKAGAGLYPGFPMS